MRRESKTAGRLELDTGEIVVFQLRADGGEQARVQRDFVLNEQALQLRGALLRIEEQCRCLCGRIARDAIPATPQHVVSRAELRLVLDLDVERIALLAKLVRHRARHPVVVGLNLPLGTTALVCVHRARRFPPDTGVSGRVHETQPSDIGVALHRDLLVGRSGPSPRGNQPDRGEVDRPRTHPWRGFAHREV